MASYSHLDASRQVNLRYGSKIRYARCLLGNATSAEKMNPGTFTEEELATIKRIETDVIARAEKEYKDAKKASAANPDSGSAPVDSVSTGK
jgi:hypothetical protein